VTGAARDRCIRAGYQDWNGVQPFVFCKLQTFLIPGTKVRDSGEYGEYGEPFVSADRRSPVARDSWHGRGRVQPRTSPSRSPDRVRLRARPYPVRRSTIMFSAAASKGLTERRSAPANVRILRKTSAPSFSAILDLIIGTNYVQRCLACRAPLLRACKLFLGTRN